MIRMNHTNGRISERSKQRIVKGLLTVMEQYDFKEITVTQICQEAELSRKTFYRLFSDKNEVLGYLFTELSLECIAQIKEQGAKHYWDVVQIYFDFCEKQKSLLFLLRKHKLLGQLFEVSYQHSLTVFEYVRSKEIAEAFAAPLPYILAYSIGGMNSMLLRWIEDDMKVPASELIMNLKTGFASPEL